MSVQQLDLLPAGARCGYCERELVPVTEGYGCPRCAPILQELGAGMEYEALIEAFKRFQKAAWRDRVIWGTQ